MAARLRPRHQDDIRNKIRAAQLVKYLEEHALENKGAENSATRIRAAIALLNKVVPDLSQVEGPGEDGAHKVVHQVVVEVVRGTAPGSGKA